MIKNINNLSEEKKQLEKEIAAYSDNDPIEIERQQKLVCLLKESTNIWIGRFFCLPSSCLLDRNMEDAIMAGAG